MEQIWVLLYMLIISKRCFNSWWRSYTRIRWFFINCTKKCSVIFAENKKTFCFSLHYNGAKSYLFVNGTEIHKFKAVKQIFASTMTPFSCSVLNVNSLKCASINNQECKIRPKIININSNEPVFFPYSINVSKCSGSCNNINDP